MKPLVLHGARNGAVVIENDTIGACGAAGAVPGGADVLDCSGCTIVPGFWNAHVHFFERKWDRAAEIPETELAAQLQEFARYGFTSVFDLSSDIANTAALRARIAQGIAGPRIFSTGPGLVPPGALPPDAVSRAMGIVPTAMPMVSTENSALRAVDALIDAGADAIKIFASGNAPETVMQPEVFRAAAARAHRHGKAVFVHPNSAGDIRIALQNGADVIAHTTPRTPWDADLLQAIAASAAALTPTLRLWDEFLRHDRISVREQMAQTAAAQLRAWMEGGREVLFGTDYGAVGADPSGEYALMQQAGMSVRDILASLTQTPANRFVPDERTGRVEPGCAADLVVLDGSLDDGVEVLTRVRYTIRSGRVVFARHARATDR